MDDVRPLALEDRADSPNAGWSNEKTEIRRSHAVDPRNAYRVDRGRPGCRRHDEDLVAGGREMHREVTEMQLDAADARMKPVANECDLHASTRDGSRLRDALERAQHALHLFVRVLG